MRVTQNGLNSVLVSWTAGDMSVTGYFISYSSEEGGETNSLSAEESDTHITISELTVGTTYTVNISANSSTLPSTVVTRHITLGIYIIIIISSLYLLIFFTESGSISICSSQSSPVTAGSAVNLTCSITLPSGVTSSPQFEWDGPLTKKIIRTGEEGIMSSQLTINDVEPSDAGPYTCTATLGGSVSTTINITVQGNNTVL